MYKTILMTLDSSPADRPIIEHIKQLAKIMTSKIILLHVATGAPAQWNGPNAGGEEIEKAQKYLDKIRAEFTEAGITAEAILAYGDPVREIIKRVTDSGCSLLAMGTHGHKLLGDLIHGTTASRVQHSIDVPVLMIRAK